MWILLVNLSVQFSELGYFTHFILYIFFKDSVCYFETSRHTYCVKLSTVGSGS